MLVSVSVFPEDHKSFVNLKCLFSIFTIIGGRIVSVASLTNVTGGRRRSPVADVHCAAGGRANGRDVEHETRTPVPWRTGGVETWTDGPPSRLSPRGHITEHVGLRTGTGATWHMCAGAADRPRRAPSRRDRVAR